MYASWEDPYDIDRVYDEVGSLFRSVAPYQPPIANVSVEDAPNADPITTLDNAKSTFEVRPYEILPDGGNIGSQPSYNVLRSGPPAAIKDGFRSMANYATCAPDIGSQISIILLWIIILFMGMYIIKLSSTIETHKLLLLTIANNMMQAKRA